MHEMKTIVTDVCSVCLSVCLSTISASLCGSQSVQPLPNYFVIYQKQESSISWRAACCIITSIGLEPSDFI